MIVTTYYIMCSACAAIIGEEDETISDTACGVRYCSAECARAHTADGKCWDCIEAAV